MKPSSSWAPSSVPSFLSSHGFNNTALLIWPTTMQLIAQPITFSELDYSTATTLPGGACSNTTNTANTTNTTSTSISVLGAPGEPLPLQFEHAPEPNRPRACATRYGRCSNKNIVTILFLSPSQVPDEIPGTRYNLFWGTERGESVEKMGRSQHQSHQRARAAETRGVCTPSILHGDIPHVSMMIHHHEIPYTW